MVGMGAFSFNKKKNKELDEEREELIRAVSETKEKLRMARIYFDNVAASELIDESVYEINALQARYSYLLRRIRELDMQQKEAT